MMNGGAVEGEIMRRFNELEERNLMGGVTISEHPIFGPSKPVPFPYYAPGVKLDGGKQRWDLLVWDFVAGIVSILTFGSGKYSDNSWQNVPNAGERYFAAMHRHLFAWRGGETHDPESGHHHLFHAACNMMFLWWLEKRKATKDEN